VAHSWGNIERDADASLPTAVIQYQQKMADAFASLQPGRDSASNVLVWRLTRAASLAERALESSVHRPRGRTWASYRVLFALRSLGPTEPGILADVLDIAPPSVSSLLSTLERAALITRRPDPANRRRVIVELTEAGDAAAEETISAQSDGEDSFLAGLSHDEVHTLSGILDKLVMHQWAVQRQAKTD
jgi:MarR family transcriptional regulator, negative regulator of the multidrug operon emrRAB